MKIYIMTDLEGVAGVQNFEDWCSPGSRYYETGKELLTREVNAAIDGFFAAGATEIVVADGHGWGAINPILLDKRAELIAQWFEPAYPFLLEKSYAAAAWVGQHARSRTEYAHLAHTGSCAVYEYTINGRAVGEFEEIALCAAELGVPSIFGAGDAAFGKQAKEFSAAIETVAVKRGTRPGKGDECDAGAYGKRNRSAIHFHPEKSRNLIRAGAEKALRRFIADKSEFKFDFPKPPYEIIKKMRADKTNPPRTGRAVHPSSIIALLNEPVVFNPSTGLSRP